MPPALARLHATALLTPDSMYRLRAIIPRLQPRFQPALLSLNSSRSSLGLPSPSVAALSVALSPEHVLAGSGEGRPRRARVGAWARLARVWHRYHIRASIVIHHQSRRPHGKTLAALARQWQWLQRLAIHHDVLAEGRGRRAGGRACRA